MATNVRLPEVPSRPLWNRLSPREKNVAGWIKAGKSCKEIAAILNVRGDTMRVTHARMRRKIRAANNAQLVAMLLEEKHRAELRHQKTP